MSKENKSINKETRKDSEKIDGKLTTKKTNTKILEGTGTEVLIGKDIDQVNKVKEDFDTLEKKLLNKLMN